MPPLTPSRILAMRLRAVLVLDLALGQLFERDREVVPGLGLDHRRRVLLVGALVERAVVAVELARALRDDDHRGVVRAGLVQQGVDPGLDHRGDSTRATRTSLASAMEPVTTSS